MALREVNQLHMKKLNNLESERSKLIEKISNDKLVQMLKGQKCSFDQTGQLRI